jgi:hypothetical protein
VKVVADTAGTIDVDILRTFAERGRVVHITRNTGRHRKHLRVVAIRQRHLADGCTLYDRTQRCVFYLKLCDTRSYFYGFTFTADL